jgi:serine phosphatase RsbU (regulator of sigma subunit)
LEFLVEERTNQLKEANTELKQTIEEVKAANEQIENQRNVLELTTIELEKKNKNITASISYAKRIQFAMLPSEEEMKKVFKQCFLYYKPRDIVSGDFYWMAIQRYNLDYERIFITVADCTGHGVPGAILSMVGNTLLTEAVNFKNLSEPVDILHEVNQGFIKMFKQDKNTIQDGMDIALCVIERSPNMEGKAILKFSGANNPLIIFQNNDLQEFKGDKKPIGGGDLFIKLNKPFTQKLIEINSPTMCYIFSDGFEDQFGGEENKKLTSKKFKQILNEIHHLDAQKQFEYLQNYMKNWMKNTNQLDDQLIIGFLI